MDSLPPNALLYLPTLVQVQTLKWPGHPIPHTLAAQVEQETCYSLKHKGCWNPKTELKTSREYGFGLGQITVTNRFNTFEEERAATAELKDWKWEDRYNPTNQLIAMVTHDLRNYKSLSGTATDYDRLAFAYAAYNGGMGGLLSDRKVCAATADCDQGRWFGHVERTSLKAKTVAGGYGQSFFQTNRGYVTNIMKVRLLKYEDVFKGVVK